MKTFKMIRVHDESGVSGTGHVLDGVVFYTGQVVVCWCAKHGHSNIGIYKDWEDFKFIHIDSHPSNATKMIWGTEYVTPPRYDEVYREGIVALEDRL